MRISVFDSKELQAVLLSIRGFDAELRKQIRQQTKGMAQPEWQKAVTERANSNMEQRVLASTARVTASDQNVTLQSARIGRSLSGGLKPSEGYGGVEFGANRNVRTTYTATSTKGKSFQVTRRTRSQFRSRNRTGYVVYPAAAEMIPRLAALWAQTVVRTFNEAIERR